jgi:Domain of unknown function (DUF4111)
VQKQLESLLSGLRAVLADDLLGLYLHGSLVLGCFNPRRSDIDVIAVTRRAVTDEERVLLGELMLHTSGQRAGPRPPCPLELSMLIEAQLRPWRYPTPFDFHYGESQRRRFSDGDFKPLWPEDHDLAAHVTVLREAGLALHGPAVEEVFPVVPESDYFDSLVRDLASCRQRGLALYAFLSASRIWATLAERRMHSKLSGSLWALDHAPTEFRPLISRALAVYRGESDDDEFELRAVSAYLDFVEPIAARYARS